MALLLIATFNTLYLYITGALVPSTLTISTFSNKTIINSRIVPIMSNEKIQQKFEQAYHSFIEEENYEEALKRAEILCLLNPQFAEFHHM